MSQYFHVFLPSFQVRPSDSEPMVDESDGTFNSEYYAGVDSGNDDIESYSYADNITDGYSSRDDQYQHTDEISHRQNHADETETTSTLRDFNDGVASRCVRDLQTSSARTAPFSFLDDDNVSINRDINQCTQSSSSGAAVPKCPPISAVPKRPPPKILTTAKSIRRAVNEALRKKKRDASWVPSSDEDD